MTETGVVHVVDDEEALRDALTFLFESRGYEARAYASAEEFLEQWREEGPACLLLDVRMDGMSGLELHQELVARGNRTPIIFLTGHGDVPMAVGAIKTGAVDFIQKPFSDNELVDRVVEAIEAHARLLEASAQQTTLTARLAQLTTREREVMRLVLAGKLNKLIAEELGISMRTVEVHRARVLEKMGVRSAVELARLLAASGGASAASP